MAEPIERTEELIEAGPVRPLPVRAQGRTIEIWGREVGPLAVAATAGAAAGVAVIAVARAARAPSAPPRRGSSGGGEGRRQPQLPGRRARPRALAAPLTFACHRGAGHAPLALPPPARGRGGRRNALAAAVSSSGCSTSVAALCG